jgi:hypothetical protein
MEEGPQHPPFAGMIPNSTMAESEIPRLALQLCHVAVYERRCKTNVTQLGTEKWE